jgi:hypothetical protein
LSFRYRKSNYRDYNYRYWYYKWNWSNDIVTYWSKPSEVDRKTFYAEGKGVISPKYGEIATWKGYGIGHYNGHNRTDRDSVFFKSSTNGKLSFLNNKKGVFEYDADANGNTNEKIWEWK